MAIPLIYSIRSIAVRKGSSAMAVGGIALVVVVFVVLLALAAGFRRAIEVSGNPNNIIVLRKGADAELQSQVTRDTARIIAQLPIVARDEKGQPLFLQESVIILARPKKDGGETNITVRGAAPDARKVHSEVRVKEGRWFTPGTDEAVIGVGLARRLEGFALGGVVTIGKYSWKIVGLFEANGSALESELWFDVDLLQSAFHRNEVFQSLLFRAEGDPQEALKFLDKTVAADPRLRSVQGKIETTYYQEQSRLMASLIETLGRLLTSIMAIGAIVGAMNTMYAAVSQRQREIGCMLAMGFPPISIFFAFMAESLVLSGIGAVIGCGLAMFFDGIKTGTTNFATFSETAFEFIVTPEILLQASAIALFMGFIGGILPAIRAARMKVVDALRRA
ncbi:MAG TPA: ABC transporter permease [Planctomycetota bacterium]|nr:ABC transporter permease [Planctomycetota bacterium]